MEIVEYKQSPFYPLKKDLKKHEKEKHQKLEEINSIYSNIKQHYIERLVGLGV